MDVKALRLWGMAVSGALLAGAITLSLVLRPMAAPVMPVAPRIDTATFIPSAPHHEAAPPPAAQPPRIVVRFVGRHPLARAEALAARGRITAASRLARRTLAQRRDLRGLCFDSFTPDRRMLVLKSCNATGNSQDFVSHWRTRLRGAAGVAYLEIEH